MDYELYSKIKKCNLSVLRELQKSELPWAYFVCYRMTGDAPTAAELLRRSWKSATEAISKSAECPRISFRACLSKEIYRLSETVTTADELFSELEIPRLTPKFDTFIEEIDRMKPNERKGSTEYEKHSKSH